MWFVLWSALLPLALGSALDHCGIQESSSSHDTASTLLGSLQCHNDYETYVHCRWRRHRNTTLQLWFKTKKNRSLCVPYNSPDHQEHETVQCRYNTRVFSIGVKHTVFFLENETLSVCASVPHKPLELSDHLRARSPVGLSSHDAGDGGRWLRWSGPYPSSSSLNNNLTYQLSYRPENQPSWTTEDVTNTSVRLERRQLPAGRSYEARVRARASVGQWSDWSPVVTWATKENTGQIPSLNCVLVGEKEVMCSWEVNKEQAQSISYRLACRHRHTAASEECCTGQTVSSDRGRAALTYSCSLSVDDPAHLLLELLPTRRAKTFKAHQHIHPNPPQQVKVKEKNQDWIVEWTEPSTASKLTLSYQVCYYRTQEKGCSNLLNISDASTSLTLHGASLAPSQQYQVKVRSLLVPGEGSRYEGIPSEWTDPVDWTTHAASWSLTTLIYVLICVFVTTIFFTLYCTTPVCQRRVILWMDSVPSPAKSKILSKIESAASWTQLSEDTSICKALQFYSTAESCTDAPVWPIMDVWNSDDLATPVEKVTISDTSSISFSGPYIFCQGSESKEEDKKDKTVSEDSPFPGSLGLRGKDYVCLPNHTVSTSTQDLVSSSSGNTNTHEQDRQCPDTEPGSDKTDVQPGLSRTAGGDQTLSYTSEPFTSWPQGGTVNTSGYSFLSDEAEERFDTHCLSHGTCQEKKGQTTCDKLFQTSCLFTATVREPLSPRGGQRFGDVREPVTDPYCS